MTEPIENNEVLDTIYLPSIFFVRVPCCNVLMRYYYLEKKRNQSVMTEHLLRLLKVCGSIPISLVQSYFSLQKSEFKIFIGILLNLHLIQLIDGDCIALTQESENLLGIDSEGKPYLKENQLHEDKTQCAFFNIEKEIVFQNYREDPYSQNNKIPVLSLPHDDNQFSSQNIQECFQQSFNLDALDEETEKFFHSIVHMKYKLLDVDIPLQIGISSDGIAKVSVIHRNKKIHNLLSRSLVSRWTSKIYHSCQEYNPDFEYWQKLADEFWSDTSFESIFKIHNFLSDITSIQAQSPFSVRVSNNIEIVFGESLTAFITKEQMTDSIIGKILLEAVSLGERTWYSTHSINNKLAPYEYSRTKQTWLDWCREIADEKHAFSELKSSIENTFNQIFDVELKKFNQVISSPNIDFVYVDKKVLFCTYFFHVGEIDIESSQIPLLVPLTLISTKPKCLNTMHYLFSQHINKESDDLFKALLRYFGQTS